MTWTVRSIGNRATDRLIAPFPTTRRLFIPSATPSLSIPFSIPPLLFPPPFPFSLSSATVSEPPLPVLPLSRAVFFHLLSLRISCLLFPTHFCVIEPSLHFLLGSPPPLHPCPSALFPAAPVPQSSPSLCLLILLRLIPSPHFSPHPLRRSPQSPIHLDSSACIVFLRGGLRWWDAQRL